MGLSFQVGHSLLDQDAVPFPFHEGLLEEHNEPLGLRGIVTAGVQIFKQVLLVAQALPPVHDILVGLDQKRFLGSELPGRIGRKSHAAT
jgi:hypothetical protein